MLDIYTATISLLNESSCVLIDFFSQFQAKLKNLISIPVKCICLGTGVITFHETSKSCTNRGQNTDVAI